MKRLSPLFEVEKDCVSTVQEIVVNLSTYYIDKMKKGGYALSKDEYPIGEFDSKEDAINWIYKN